MIKSDIICMAKTIFPLEESDLNLVRMLICVLFIVVKSLVIIWMGFSLRMRRDSFFRLPFPFPFPVPFFPLLVLLNKAEDVVDDDE